MGLMFSWEQVNGQGVVTVDFSGVTNSTVRAHLEEAVKKIREGNFRGCYEEVETIIGLKGVQKNDLDLAYQFISQMPKPSDAEDKKYALNVQTRLFEKWEKASSGGFNMGLKPAMSRSSELVKD